MTIHFKRETDQQIQLALANLDKYSLFSAVDRCRVVRLGCTCCGKGFLEELGMARAKVLNRRAFLCIDCDPEASETSLWDLIIHFS